MSFTTKLQLIAEIETALQQGGIDAFKEVCNRIKWEAKRKSWRKLTRIIGGKIRMP
jgi:dihydroorotate dehydrogenase